jgi:hypothetical protein
VSNDIGAPGPEERVLTGSVFARLWFLWVSRVTNRLNGQEPLKIKAYEVAKLPDAAAWPNSIVIVTDEDGGRTIATSDGTSWLRVSDGTEVST